MPGKNALRNLFWAISLLGTPFFYIPATAYFLKVNPNLAVSLIFILVFNEVVCGAVKFVYPKERPIPMPRNNLFKEALFYRRACRISYWDSYKHFGIKYSILMVI